MSCQLSASRQLAPLCMIERQSGLLCFRHDGYEMLRQRVCWQAFAAAASASAMALVQLVQPALLPAMRLRDERAAPLLSHAGAQEAATAPPLLPLA